MSGFLNNLHSIRHKTSNGAKWSKYAGMSFLTHLRTVVLFYNSSCGYVPVANTANFVTVSLVVMYDTQKNWHTSTSSFYNNEYNFTIILIYKPLHHSASIKQKHQLITPRATRIAYFSGFTSIVVSPSINGLLIALLI